MVHRETFLRIHLHQLNRQHVVLEACMQEVLQLHVANLCPQKQEDLLQNLGIPTPRFARKFSTWNPPSHTERTYPQNCMVEQPRNQVSEMHFDNFPNPFDLSVLERRASKPRYVPVLAFPGKFCCGSQKWRWSNQCTILRRRSQGEGVYSRILRSLMRRLRPS